MYISSSMLPRLLLLAVIVTVIAAEYCRFEISKRHAKYKRCPYGCCTGDCCDEPVEEEETSVGLYIGVSVLSAIVLAVISYLCPCCRGGDGEIEIEL